MVRGRGPSTESDRTVLAIFAVLTLALALLIVLPYLQYILFAAVLAYVLAPIQRRLEARMAPTAAAVSVIAVTTVVIIVPLAYLAAVAIRQALGLYAAFQEGQYSPEQIQRHLEDIGFIVDLEVLYEIYQEPIGGGIDGVISNTLSLIGGVPSLLIGLTITAFVLFSLLRDGEMLISWLMDAVPLDESLERELLAELDSLMWASLVGNVVVAGIQALLLGIGLWLVGMPGFVLLTFVTFVFALLPLIGAFAVWIPSSIFLFAIGRPVAAGALVVYGSFVSLSDLYMRPMLIKRNARLDASIIVLGMFGGIVLFGGIGLFVGPVALGGTKVTIDIYARQREAFTAVSFDDREPVDPGRRPTVDSPGEPTTATVTEAGTDSRSDSGPESTSSSVPEPSNRSDPARSDPEGSHSTGDRLSGSSDGS